MSHPHLASLKEIVGISGAGNLRVIDIIDAVLSYGNGDLPSQCEQFVKCKKGRQCVLHFFATDVFYRYLYIRGRAMFRGITVRLTQ